MAIISCTQANKDVLLLDALRQVPADAGFYIDVGSDDPEKDSITKLFYERGWHGINIGSSADRFSQLSETRTRDINIQAVASNRSGEEVFHGILGDQTGTAVDGFAESRSAGKPSAVKAVTLTQLCKEHAPKDIHFLNIDVEGRETEVLEGMDFARFRPWVLVIKASEPKPCSTTNYKWDQLVREAGYRFVFKDTSNRYYVATEHAELASKFSALAHEYTADRLVRFDSRLDEFAAHLTQFEHRISQLDTRFNDYQRHNESLILSGEFETHDEVRNILRLLRPYAVNGFSKARFGNAHDGGYVLIDDFRGVDTAFSFGIEQNASWDLDVARKGVTIYEFDHTVDAPVTDNARLIFARKRISTEVGPDSESVPSLINRYDKQNVHPNILLKIDIENDEWAVFDATPPEMLKRFSQIVVEFHFFNSFSDFHWRRLYARVFKKMSEAYAVVHVHANNFGGVSNVANVVVPNVIEITFANRDVYSFSETDEIFPGSLDVPNDPNHPDIHLGSFRF